MCDGYHSNLLLSILNNTHKPYIYNGCEPVVDLFNKIQLKTNDKGSATKHNVAISDQDGVTELYKSGGKLIVDGVVRDSYYGSSSIRKPKLVTESWTSMTFTTTTTTTITFDTLVANQKLQGETIDFIWSDIQGAEIDLINGGKQAFKNTRYFFTEYNNSELYEGAISLAKISEMLPDFEVIYDWGGDALLMNTKSNHYDQHQL